MREFGIWYLTAVVHRSARLAWLSFVFSHGTGCLRRACHVGGAYKEEVLFSRVPYFFFSGGKGGCCLPSLQVLAMADELE